MEYHEEGYPIPRRLGGLGERRELPQRGPGQSPGRKRILASRAERHVKAKFHFTILVADRFEAGRRSAASWNMAYHLAR